MSTLRSRLLWPTLLLTGLVGAALAWVAWDATVTMNRLERDVANVRTANAFALRLSSVNGERQRLVVTYRYSGDDDTLREIQVRDNEISDITTRIQSSTLTARGQRIWAQYIAMQALRDRAFSSLVAAIRSRDAARVTRAYERYSIASRNVRALLADFTGHSLRRLDSAIADLGRRRTRSLVFLVALLGAGILAVIGFRVYLGRRIVRPLVAMATTADRIARDKEAIPVEGAHRDDEIGVLARAFNEMTGDLVRANASLAEALHVRDEFLSIASHELKTPLTSLRLQLDLLSRRMSALGVVPPQVAAALRQERRLEALISELLDVTRIRAGKFLLHRRSVDLSQLVASVLERFAAELERDGVAVEAALEPDLVGHWDAERLDQVVTNLVSNVAKYAPQAPLVVRTWSADGKALLEVRDRGPGISSSVRERLFEPYQRGASDHGMGGLGLGLYIVKEIAAAHDGDVTVESEEGQGAAFVVSLPRNSHAT